ncbi:MAG TPA: cyclase family protein [Burkholderiales bacterium]|nr:cyclase family protein [Burkholderiales bacterium]
MNRHLSLILLLVVSQVHAADDELGMAAQLGPKNWASCARFLGQPQAKVYELSQLRSPTMPLSPFAGPFQMKPKPSAAIPGTTHSFNTESYNEGAEPGQQGTQIDALGHFGVRKQPWDGKPPLPIDIVYYGGLPQSEVKPTPDSPLLKLGIEKIPPLITTAVLLDAKALVGGGKPMAAGALVTAKHIQEMLKAQGLDKRGLRAGDIVYVHTGWGERWQDPDVDKAYYASAPGLSYDAAKYLGERRIVAIGLDTPFIDPVPDGMLAGKGAPAAGTPPGMPFAVHHHMLTQAGIHHIENAKLDELARDKVWLSCTIVLPLREKGAAGSAVRPVAIGVAGKSSPGR